MQEDWNAPIYAFYKPTPAIGYEGGRRYYEFKCAAKGCKKGIRRYLDTKDAKSTSNMRKHAKNCWGADTVLAADNAKDVGMARDILKQRDSSITAAFERVGKGKVTYSHRQHTKTETK